jgi:radical SAM superfamily enzyme YgiQ (UPF0313 family)
MSADSKPIKLVLVEPTGSYANVFARYMTIPMLGPVYLGTIAKKAGYDVLVLNENILGRKVRSEELADADVLGLSCLTATVDRGREIARQYKALRAAAGKPSRTIIGGIHASMMPDDVAGDFDQVFVGEAETKFLDLLSGSIPDKIIFGRRLENMDSLPVPDFTLLKGWQKIRVWPVMTSRGCPYACNFCSVTQMFGRGYRTRSVEKVMEDVAACPQGWAFFVDDHFVVDKKRTAEMVQRIKTAKPGLKWSCQLRAEVSRDRELVRAMSDSGCKMVYIGFESINPESLREMAKGQTVEDIRTSIAAFRRERIGVHGMFMFGSDSDRKGIFESTSKFCLQSRLASVQYLVLTPLPGTEYYRKIESEGRLLHRDWRFYDAMHVVFKPKNFTPAELQQGVIDSFSDFYNYGRAFNDALAIFFETGDALLQSLSRRVKFPTLTPALVKAFGRKIVSDWVRFNRSYLGYLDIVSAQHKTRQE